ncbi:helix-hairpin-helix domain-containing protein [Salinisphaera orenii]|uniref:ComEA family DNA-binding protein n=1 Tax=Salinisphaera orenii TaxID=856731 RepID=UPI000F47B175
MPKHGPVYIVLGDAEVNADSAGSPGPTQTGNCIDLNRGTLAALDELEHVGPSRAQEIIARRPWHRLEDLTRGSGLSDARVADIAGSGLVCSLP